MANKRKKNAHSVYNYYECYAKVLLEEIYPNIYYNLEIKDKPDLQNTQSSLGVEVTTCIEQNLLEAQQNWLIALRSSDKNKTEKAIERMNQLGYTFTGGLQCWSLNKNYTYEDLFGDPEFDRIYKMTNEKFMKLNNTGYQLLDKIDLFIHSEIYIPQNKYNDILTHLKEINVDKRYFQYIFITTSDNQLFLFDMIENRCIVKSYDEQQFAYSKQAAQMMNFEHS